MNRVTVFLLLVLMAGSVCLAGQPVDETRNADADGVVAVELIAGEIRVIGWGRSEVQVTGTLGKDVERIDISANGRRTSIELVLPEGEQRGHRDISADLEIHVPEASTLEVETVSADISVKEVTGILELESVSGDVELAGGMNEAEVATVNGRILVDSRIPLREVEFASVSGNVEVRAPLEPGGTFEFDTVSGNIELRLPANTSAEFEIETFSGSIKNELGPAAEKSSDYLPSKSLSFTTGSGDASVEIESFSGRISLLVD